jgi:hypothetical protein
MLTIKLIGSSEFSLKKKIQGKKPLPVPAVAVNKPRPSVVSLQAHNQADVHLKTLIRK